MLKKSVVLSFVIPAFNVEEYLRDCIQSIIGYFDDDIEVIIVDDGSTDATAAIADEYAATDSRVKSIHIQNSGQSIARNTGLKEAQGNYIWFVDSDDFLAKGSVELAMQVINCMPEVDGIVFDLCHVAENESTIPPVDYMDWERYLGGVR